MLIRKNLEFSPRSSVCPFVRSSGNISKSVHYFFLKICSYFRPFTDFRPKSAEMGDIRRDLAESAKICLTTWLAPTSE